MTRQEIIDAARKHYPGDDNSHGWNHITKVVDHAKKLLGRDLTDQELAAVVYHDSSLASKGRETHAKDSAEIAEKELAGAFRKKQLREIVKAIAHHRASYVGKRTGALEDLVASADRDAPDMEDIVMRSYAYHREHGEPDVDAFRNVAEHMADKYGVAGYAFDNAPALYMKAYKDRLDEMRRRFSAMTPGRVAEIVGTKTASSKKRETYESGIGKVVSYTPDKTKGHDEIVVRLKDGHVIRISNNTELGRRIKAKIGEKMGYHGYRIDGTNVVHKVHSNRKGFKGWLDMYPEEMAKSAEDNVNCGNIPLTKDRRKYLVGIDDKVSSLNNANGKRYLSQNESSMLANMSKKLDNLSPKEKYFLRRVWLARNFDGASKRVQRGVQSLPDTRFVMDDDQFGSYMSELYSKQLSDSRRGMYARR